MRGVAKRTEIGVVGSNDYRAAARRQQPMNLFHQANHVGDVFYNVNRPHFPERFVAKRKREVIQIGNNVGARVRIVIEPDGARILVDPAADVEYRKGAYASNDCRHFQVYRALNRLCCHQTTCALVSYRRVETGAR